MVWDLAVGVEVADLRAVGDFAVDGPQELHELAVAVAGQALCDHRSGEHIH
jgi:hypothetical protein